MKYALAVAIAILAGLTISAQEPTTLRVDVRLVNVVTTVTDNDGKFVPGLAADDFTILEDGVPQKITPRTTSVLRALDVSDMRAIGSQ